MSAHKKPNDKPKDLECLFTWEVNITDINDLQGIPEKLLDRVKYCPHRYHATYYNILAFVSHLDKKTDMALEYLAKAEAVLREEKQDEADFLVSYSSFAWLYHHLGKLEDMETYLGKVRSIGEGRDIAVEAEKGWSFIRLGAKFYQRAKECFEKALEVKPDSTYYNVGYAMALYRLEELDREKVKVKPERRPTATQQLQKALKLDPSNSEVMVLLALKARDTQRINQALKEYPNAPHVIRYAGLYFRRQGNYAKALEIFEKALKSTPNSSFLYHHMGVCHWGNMFKMKKARSNSLQVTAATKKSIDCFEKAVELKPSNTYAYVYLAQAYVENQQLKKAEEIYTKLVSNDSLSDAERQHCHVKYGLFLIYQRKENVKATQQLKEGYKIRIDSEDRREARKKLNQIASKNKSWRSQENDYLGILAFLSEQDQPDQAEKADESEPLNRAEAAGGSEQLNRAEAAGQSDNELHRRLHNLKIKSEPTVHANLQDPDVK